MTAFQAITAKYVMYKNFQHQTDIKTVNRLKTLTTLFTNQGFVGIQCANNKVENSHKTATHERKKTSNMI